MAGGPIKAITPGLAIQAELYPASGYRIRDVPLIEYLMSQSNPLNLNNFLNAVLELCSCENQPKKRMTPRAKIRMAHRITRYNREHAVLTVHPVCTVVEIESWQEMGLVSEVSD